MEANMTKEELAEYQKKYREEHREQINANKRYWYKRNPEKAKEQAKKDNAKAYAKHKNDPEYKAKRNEYAKRWRDNNRDKYNAYYRKYYRQKKLAERSEA
jgi:hypothetical protein